MYERYEKLLKLKCLKNSDIARITGISNMTLSDWKNGKSTPKADKIQKIADALNVTVEYLMCKTDLIECEVCGSEYNPLDDESNKKHDLNHANYEKAKEIYPFLAEYKKSLFQIEFNKMCFMNENNEESLRLYYLDEYLKYEYSRWLAECGYVTEKFAYEDCCKMIVSEIHPDEHVSYELCELIYDKYGVDKSFLDKNAGILAKASNNPQLIRMLKYAEALSKDKLDMIEIQLKALYEQNKRE